ncbi:hypothetical protein R1sor_011707 [Riccia sorocarpa]|uniref:Uncharacterized protein n=1 Tax=Riccia sorocarpa TaxID=122646 RepID=A0ABD3I5Y9_9MARC
MAGPSVGIDAKEEAATLIRQWCNEKGPELFVDHLLKLLDVDYLRSWPGLAHVSLPKRKDRLAKVTDEYQISTGAPWLAESLRMMKNMPRKHVWVTSQIFEEGPFPGDGGTISDADDSGGDDLGGDAAPPDLDVITAEIVEEDLPRLGILKLGPEFSAEPFEWQMADENWPSASTSFSHSTELWG